MSVQFSFVGLNTPLRPRGREVVGLTPGWSLLSGYYLDG